MGEKWKVKKAWRGGREEEKDDDEEVLIPM